MAYHTHDRGGMWLATPRAGSLRQSVSRQIAAAPAASKTLAWRAVRHPTVNAGESRSHACTPQTRPATPARCPSLKTHAAGGSKRNGIEGGRRTGTGSGAVCRAKLCLANTCGSNAFFFFCRRPQATAKAPSRSGARCSTRSSGDACGKA